MLVNLREFNKINFIFYHCTKNFNKVFAFKKETFIAIDVKVLF